MATVTAVSSGLSEHILADLRAVFRQYPQVERVLLFGSRAKGFAKPGSDIDLAVFAPSMSQREFARLWDALEDLPLVYTLDVLFWNELGQEDLKDNILRDGQTLYEAGAPVVRACPQLHVAANVLNETATIKKEEDVMKFGVAMFATDYAVRPDEFARECEARGFESVWFPEHTHIPASRKSPWPLGGDLPKDYWHTHDLFVCMMAAAAATKTIKIGSGICLVIEHDPIKLAKEVASLDMLSNGRVLFGIGGGWNAEEMENHGTPFKKRWKVLREKIEAMKEIWTKENAEYHGEFVNFDPIWCHPKPVQKPYPPILLGVHSGNGLNRVVNYCDGWIPVGAAMEDFSASLQDLKSRAEKAGRNPKELSISIFMAPDKEDLLRQYQSLGVERVVFGVPSEGKDKVLPLLDQYARVIPQFA